MVINALDRMGMPCVRFDFKDVIQWDPNPCSCGRTYRVLKGGIVDRADDITKVKGVLLAPSSIEEVVWGLEGLGNEYEVVVDKLGDAEKGSASKWNCCREMKTTPSGLKLSSNTDSDSKPTCAMRLSFMTMANCPGMKSKPEGSRT